MLLTARRNRCDFRTTLQLSIPLQSGQIPIYSENTKDIQLYSIGKLQSNLLNTKYHIAIDSTLSNNENELNILINNEV